VAKHFGDRLAQAVRNKKTPLIVGIDPVYSRLPAKITSHKEMNDEFDIASAIDAVFEFCTKTLRIVAPLVPAVKINMAYFEKYLWEGNEMFYSLISEADELDLEIIADVKRGDVGHTAQAYAEAHLQNPEYTGLEDVITADAITINPFAGSEGIDPFAKIAAEQGKGVFAWVRPSNPSAEIISDFTDANGKKLYQLLAETVAQSARKPELMGESGYSSVGMVAAGLEGDEAAAMREQYEDMWLLVPGYGAQGATAADCAKLCKQDGTGALVSASRSIIYAYEKPEFRDVYKDNWEKCIEQAVIKAKVDISNAMGA
jgi:orotidine-5'-phosphate decarboxylase